MPNIELHYPQERTLEHGSLIWEFLIAKLPEIVSRVVISYHSTFCFDVRHKPMPYIRLYYDGADEANEIAQLKDFLRTLADVEVIQLEEFLEKIK